MVQHSTDTRAQSNVATGLPAGFDGGNTDSCLTIFDGGVEKTIIIPSTVTKVVNNKLATLREATASSIDGEITRPDTYHQDILLEYQGETYLVGYSAMRQAKRANAQRGDESRYFSTEQIVRLLATSALAVSYSHYEMSLVTTVPYSYYTKALRQEIKQKLGGIHSYKMGGIDRHAIITVKQILVEGSPALALYGASSATKRRIVIDGGGHTTELLTFDGRDPVASLCTSIELGVETIGDYVADQLFEKHNRRLSVRERSDILRAYGSRNASPALEYPEIACGSYTVSPMELHALCRAGATQVAQSVMNEAAMLWGKVNKVVAGDVPYQYHMGGMVHFCNDIMQETEMPLLKPVTEAERANARGSARIAKMLVK